MATQIPDSSLVVFITGCSNGGIGSTLATEFAGKGCIVYASSRSLRSLSELGGNIKKLEVDVTNDASCEQAVKTIYEETGRIDIFVSNAGVSITCPLLDVSVETAKMVMDTNLYGTMRLVQLIGPQMAKRGKGLIVPIGSTAGELPVPFKGLYNASKAALHAYTETLGEECRPLGVSVMLCAPGNVSSNIANNSVKLVENKLPEDSLYHGYATEINRIIDFSQKNSTMPREEFGKILVRKALSPHPPTYMTAGGKTTLWKFLKWLPRATAIRMIWNATVGR